MKKIFSVIGAIIFYCVCANDVSAHPLDISISELNILPGARKIEVATYLHPYEGSYLLSEKNHIKLSGVNAFFENKEVFFSYLKQNLSLKNNGKKCDFIARTMPPKDEIEIVADGLELDYTWVCEAPFDLLEFSNTLFTADFSLQTNKMIFYKNGKFDQSIYEKVLTAKVFSLDFHLAFPPQKDAAKLVDADKDGLSDYEEDLYLTDPNRSDTDYDGYSDKEEVENGWDPRDPNPSPGEIAKIPVNKARQKEEGYRRTESEVLVSSGTVNQNTSTKSASSSLPEIGVHMAPTTTIITDHEPTMAALPLSAATTVATIFPFSRSEKLPGSFYFQNERLKRLLQYVKQGLDRSTWTGRFAVLLAVFLLGFFHSFEGGHGKSLLLSYLMESERTFLDGFKFSLSLALTDMAGVLLLGAGFEILFLSGEGYRYIYAIQTVGIWCLLILGIVLFGRAILHLLQPWRQQCYGHHRHGTLLGILGGLVPCASGWALILMLVSLNQFKWIIPAVLAFILGVISFLFGMSFVVVKFRALLTRRARWFVRVSPVLSGALFILIAIVQLKMVYFP